MNTAFLLLWLLLSQIPTPISQPPTPNTQPPTPSSPPTHNSKLITQNSAPLPPASSLEDQLFSLVGQNRWTEAVAICAAALKTNPSDQAVRALTIDLNMTLARRMFARERFTEAEAAARVVLSLDPASKPARRLVDSLAQARQQLPARLEEAGRLLKLERFEAAAAICRQADALDPAGQPARAALRWQALLAAADQHFLCGNYPDAFLRYEEVARLFPEGPMQNDPDLQERWVLSLILALGDSPAVAPADWAQWERLLKRALEAIKTRPNQQALSVLAGLGWDAVGNRAKSAGCFADALGRPAPPGAETNEAAFRALRTAALAAVKERADALDLSKRRGAWSAAAGVDWQTMPVSAHLVIKHFNAYAAQRTADVLRAELLRLPDLLGVSARDGMDKLPVTVWIHPDEKPFPGPPAEPLGKGRTALELTGGKLTSADIHIHQTDPLSLSSSLPHELAHVLLSAALGPRQLPLAIEEGLVIQGESPARQIMFERMCRSAPSPLKGEGGVRVSAPPPSTGEGGVRVSAPPLSTGEGGVRVSASPPSTGGGGGRVGVPASLPAGWLSILLSQRTYPADSATFYAQSATLVAYLQAKKTIPGLIAFARQTAPPDWPAALPRWLGLPDLTAMEKALGR